MVNKLEGGQKAQERYSSIKVYMDVPLWWVIFFCFLQKPLNMGYIFSKKISKHGYTHGHQKILINGMFFKKKTEKLVPFCQNDS